MAGIEELSGRHRAMLRGGPAEEEMLCSFIQREEAPAVIRRMYNGMEQCQLTNRICVCLTQKILSIVIRSLPRSIHPCGIPYSASDDVSFKLPETSVFNASLKLLRHCIIRVCHEDFGCLFPPSTIAALVALIRSDDANERRLLVGCIEEMCMAQPGCRSAVIGALGNELSGYIEGLRSHVGIDEVLGVCRTLVSNSGFQDECSAIIFYYQNILRLAETRFFENSNEVVGLCQRFSDAYPRSTAIALRYLHKVFERVCFGRKVVVISIVNRIAGDIEDRFYGGVETAVCHLISSALDSGHFRLAEEASHFLLSPRNYTKMRMHAETFVLKVFDSVYRQCKRQWRAQGSPKICKSLLLLLAMGHGVFERALRSYNYRRWTSRGSGR
jgi:hypothetical protein